MDSDTEIDPDLFLKCRLCINNAGLYQIHQSLQQQIEFCFDIIIKHDDCLSQLLCKPCKKNVADYNAAKTQYLDNQTVLRQKLNEKRLAKAETKNNNDTTISCSKEDSSTESDKNNVKDKLSNISTVSDRSNEREIENSNGNSTVGNRSSRSSDRDGIRVKTRKPKRRKSLFLSSSSSSVEDEFNVTPEVLETARSTENSQKIHKIQQKKSLSWKKYYKKRIYCRICNLTFSTKENLNNHVKTHSKLLKIQKSLIKNHCKIKMEKVDDKHNLTGTYNAVVMSSDKIVMMEGDENYFVTYVPKSENVLLKDDRKRSASRNIDLDDSSDDDFKQKHRKKKMVRLRSSSNETVVIDANTNSGSESKNNKRFSVVSDDSSDVQCVNIDDSSNDSSKKTNQPMERDLQIVHDIISGCYDKYLCNHDNGAYNDKGKKGFDLKLLNKKLFSTGRKNMMSTGVETPGLLKYLEHKNLAINWIAQAKQTNTNKSVVRIIPRVALPEQPNKETPGLLGWTPVQENIEPIEVPAISHSSSLVSNPMESVIHRVALTKTTSQDHEMANVTKLKHQNRQDVPQLQLMLESENVKKLLNANPVANPKQLPKKNAAHETKNSVISAEYAPNTVMGNNNSESQFTISDDETESNDLHNMPIITSTTSLAPQHNTVNEQHNTAAQNNVEDSLKNNTDKPVLRCKPVSQLMPQSNSLDLPNTSIQDNAVANVSSNVPALLTMPPTPSNCPMNNSVIMNSVDLPNTSTLRPIEYFKTLLQMRNMILISQKNHKLSKDFMNLVKFKLELTQSGKSLILGLALFANTVGRIFCIKIGNVNEEMDIDKLPPHWQVRILKSFRGQVSEKILECTKHINRDLQDNVRQFVLLLKNIEFI